VDRHGRSSPRHPAAAGDIVVMKLADHYYIGRVQGDGEPFAAIEVMKGRADAIALASQLVNERQRVFIYERSGAADCVEIRLHGHRLKRS
jgi:hypothetical protein